MYMEKADAAGKKQGKEGKSETQKGHSTGCIAGKILLRMEMGSDDSITAFPLSEMLFITQLTVCQDCSFLLPIRVPTNGEQNAHCGCYSSCRRVR